MSKKVELVVRQDKGPWAVFSGSPEASVYGMALLMVTGMGNCNETEVFEGSPENGKLLVTFRRAENGMVTVISSEEIRNKLRAWRMVATEEAVTA